MVITTLVGPAECHKKKGKRLTPWKRPRGCTKDNFRACSCLVNRFGWHASADNPHDCKLQSPYVHKRTQPCPEWERPPEGFLVSPRYARPRILVQPRAEEDICFDDKKAVGSFIGDWCRLGLHRPPWCWYFSEGRVGILVVPILPLQYENLLPGVARFGRDRTPCKTASDM